MTGVQKVAFWVSLDFGKTVRSSFLFGKALGVVTVEQMPTGSIGRLVLDESMKRRIPKHQRMRSISILTWFLQTDSFLDLSVYILVRTIYAYRSIFCLRITLYRRLIHGQHYVSNISHVVIVSFACDSFVCNYIEADK
jgi:hypothetical protein